MDDKCSNKQHTSGQLGNIKEDVPAGYHSRTNYSPSDGNSSDGYSDGSTSSKESLPSRCHQSSVPECEELEKKCKNDEGFVEVSLAGTSGSSSCREKSSNILSEIPKSQPCTDVPSHEGFVEVSLAGTSRSISCREKSSNILSEIPQSQPCTDVPSHEGFVEVSLAGKTGGSSCREKSSNILSEIPQSQPCTDVPSHNASLHDKHPQIKVEFESDNEITDSEKVYFEAESDERNDAPQTAKEGLSSHLSKRQISEEDDTTDKQAISNPLGAAFPNPFIMGPHMGNPHMPFQPHGINPKDPVLMFPHIPPPILVLPHQWPFLPLPNIPQKKVTEADFVRFSALNTATVIPQSLGATQEQLLHREKKKPHKKKIRHSKADTLIDPDEEESVRAKYKTEYRKANQASTMLICDKVKLPLAKPRKAPTLVDVSAEPLVANTSNMTPIAEYTTKRRRKQEMASFDSAEKLTKFKIKIKGNEGKKMMRKRKVIIDKKLKSGNGVGTCSSKARPITGQKQRKVTVKAIKTLVSTKQRKQKIDESLDIKLQKPKTKKKPPLNLTPEKILYNKLTEVVKQIAEPNIFSPMTLPPELEIKCSNCEVTYPDRKGLWDHIQSHLRKPVPFRLSKYYRFCKICKKYVSEIRDHIRACHFDGGSPYACEVCHERFRYKGLLRNHAQNRHTTARNYMCEVCGLAFKQSVTLRKHMLVHSDLKNFFCATCGKAFKTMYALQKHSVVHALVKPYKCEICNKGFTQQTNMKSHQRTHTGEKPYQCELCTMAFTHNVSLKTHKKKYHGIDMWSQAPAKQPIISSPAIQLPVPPSSQPSNQPSSENLMDENQDELDVWFPNSQPASQPDKPLSNTQPSS